MENSPRVGASTTIRTGRDEDVAHVLSSEAQAGNHRRREVNLSFEIAVRCEYFDLSCMSDAYPHGPVGRYR
jgi:hypothetical protein